MRNYYVRRALEIVRRDGPVELYKSTLSFMFHKIWPDSIAFRIQTQKNSAINNIKYDSYPDPFAKITVDPTEIEYGNTTLSHIDYDGIGRVQDGDWDKQKDLYSVDDTWIVQGLYQRFVEKKPWKETEYYERAQKKFSEKERTSFRGADSLEEFLKDRCSYVDRLYQDIKNNGYKTVDEDTETYRGHYKDKLEVLVAIGRNGDIYMHKGGYHRFSIARILECETPAHVVCRHKQWQELRDDIYNNGFSARYDEELRDHPDLQDVLNRE